MTLQFSDDVCMIRIHGNDEMHRPAALRLPAFIPQSVMSMGAAHLNRSFFKKCVDKNYGIQQHLLHILRLFSQISFASPISIKCFSLKQTCLPLKINGWKMIHFLLGQKAYFQGANLLSVSGSVAD